MAYLDDTGLAYFWGKIKAYVAALLAPKANDADVVHKTGNEVIAGVKTFHTNEPDLAGRNKVSRVVIRNDNIEKGTAPEHSIWSQLLFTDSSDNDYEATGSNVTNRIGALETGTSVSNINNISIAAYKYTSVASEQGDNAKLQVGYDSNGIAYATAPSTSSSRNNGTDVITRDWLDGSNSGVVHTTGDETIDNIKTFYYAIKQKHITYVRGTTPSSDIEKQLIDIVDANGTRIGLFTINLFSDGGNSIRLYAYDTTSASGGNIGCIGIGSDTSGNARTIAPTPALNDSSTRMATTEWVRNATGNTQLLASEIQHKHVSLTKGTNPSEFRWIRSWIIFEQTGEDLKNRISEIRSGVDPNGTVYYELLCFKYAANSTDYSSLRLVKEASGTAYVNVPTPANDSNSNIAPTTAWCRTNLVAITGDQTITGRKRFSSTEFHITLKNPDADVTANPANPRYWNIIFHDKNNAMAGRFLMYHNTNHTRGFTMLLCEEKSSSPVNRQVVGAGFYDATHYRVAAGDNNCTSFCPNIAGLTLGENSTTRRWGQIYSSSTSISTSDERAKTSVASVPDDVLDAWDAVEWVQFQMKDAVAEKGASARLHSGAIAQRISEAFSSAGLDASRYGLFCYDEWDSEPDSYDGDGNRISIGREAGDLYSLRYEEALCMEAAYQRRENARLKKRVSDLEERLAALELRLGSE